MITSLIKMLELPNFDIFHTFSGVSIVDLEQKNVCWAHAIICVSLHNMVIAQFLENNLVLTCIINKISNTESQQFLTECFKNTDTTL